MAGSTHPTAMEETERMVALKKAYAEMILNTAKEAAARVMAAERKAKKFEHDLISTKEEALRMLLRLKQMIENKNVEAEIASLNQQRRIQELELQLDEAEELILDLRAKLDEVQEQLDDAKSKCMQSLRPNEKVDMSNCHISFSELESKPVTSEVQISSWDQSIDVHQCLRPSTETALSSSEFDNGLVDVPVFAYIVLENKDPELHRNVCIERVHAIEKGLVDEKMSQVDDSRSLAKSISIIQQNGRSHITHSRSDKLNASENLVKEAPLLEDNVTKDWPVNVQKLRRRRTRYGKPKATRCRYLSDKSCLKRISSATARCKSYSVSSKDEDKSGDNSSKTQNKNEAENYSELEEKAQLGKYQSISVVRRSVRKRKVKYWDDFATSHRRVDTHPCQSEEYCRNDKAVKCGAKSGECLSEVKHEGEFDEVNGIAAFAAVSSMKAGRDSTMKAGKDSCRVGVAERESKLIREPTLIKHNGVAPEMEWENDDLVPSDKRDTIASEMTNKAPSPPDSSKPLQRSFSRKRKKVPLVNHDEGYSLREKSMKRRHGEQKDIELVVKNGSVGDESTSNGRGLAKVARQLISLSGKRCW
ncbi:hypothetical protein ACH5RR_014355 [Cinchona calisaya]|uniref:Uncharacterized protein n=1 Tax=Cinchona calisaya TaxID=153742 RepID=A0ABD3A455_9GENT